MLLLSSQSSTTFGSSFKPNGNTVPQIPDLVALFKLTFQGETRKLFDYGIRSTVGTHLTLDDIIMGEEEDQFTATDMITNTRISAT